MSDTPQASPAVTETTQASVEETGAEQVNDPAAENSEESSVEASSESASEPTKAEVKEAKDKLDAKQSKTDPEKYSIKVNGKTKEVSKEELIRLAQLGDAGHEAMQRSKQLEKEVIELLRALKSNPKSVLKDKRLGIDVAALAKEIMEEQQVEEAKSPEQRALEAALAEKEELARKLKEKEEAEEVSKKEALLKAEEEAMERGIESTLERLGMPADPIVLKRIGDVMISFYEAEEDISPEQATEIAIKQLKEEYAKLANTFSDDKLEDFLGKDFLKRVRTSALAKVKTPVPSPKATDEGIEAAQDAAEEVGPGVSFNKRKKIRMKDWMTGKVNLNSKKG